MKADLPTFETILFSRNGRSLILTFNRPDSMNAVNKQMHGEIADALDFAGKDEHSDLVVVTGAGRAFSAGGDLEHISNTAANPHLFDEDIVTAKRLVFTLLDIEKPVICKMNGHAVGLGATIALLCDVIFAADGAKIGDPHVLLGLVAGDGGAIAWPQALGFAKAKEYLFTGDLIPAQKAEEMGLINHCVEPSQLDEKVTHFCEKLLNGNMQAIRWTKILVNMELKRIAQSLMDPGMAYEALSVRSEEHKAAVAALLEKHK